MKNDIVIKINKKYTECSNIDFFCKDILKNTQNHKAYVKKKKQRLTKKNHTWCELGRDSSLGVKEGGTGSLDLNSVDSVCRCGVCRATRGRVGERCG